VHDIHPILGPDIVARGAASAGLTWHYCRPPVVEIEFEMDCRGVASERVAGRSARSRSRQSAPGNR
jgi:hypothetical protein